MTELERASYAPGATALPRGVVTFLLTDIEGSTRAWEAHSTAMAAAVRRHYEILDAAVTGNDGVRPIEQGEGDSMVAAFERATDAVAAALVAQRDLAAEPWPAGAEVSVRMALHTGEAQIRDERYYAGPAIIRCARLRGIGHGGQVLLSGTTADLLGGNLPAGSSIRPLGTHRLRDLRAPERVLQLAHPDLRADFPPLKSLDALPNNLPVQLTSFVGRDDELAALAGKLAEHRLVSLVGPGGGGKTRLAAQTAAEVLETCPQGAWWVELASVTDAARLPWVVMQALGIGDDRGLDPLDRITQFLGGGRALFVLDNCEHVLDEAASAVDRLLRSCPGLTVMTTSREPLGVPGEVVWRVSPLTMPPATAGLSPQDAGLWESIQLFAERAVDARRTFELDEASAPVVAAICERLDGMPLAIELAAARVRSLSPERILAGLTDRFRLLTGGARTAVARQQTLQASVQWSHDLLSPREQGVFRRLAACSGGFALEAAEAVAPAADVEAWEVLDVLSELVDKSLVFFDGTRYGMSQTMQDFARTQLLDSGEAAAVRDRHAAYFLVQAEAAADLMEREIRPALVYGLRSDHDNLRAALEWTAERGDDDTAARLVIALMYFWLNTGHFTEGLTWHRRVLARIPDDAEPVRCRVAYGLGNLSLQCVELSNGFGVGDITASLTLAQELGDPALIARPLAASGAVQVLATPNDATIPLAEATALARSVGDEWAVSYARWWEAAYWIIDRSRPEAAEPALAELEEMGHRGDSVSCLGWNNMLRGMSLHQQGRLAEAWAEYELSRDRSYECDEPLLEAGAFMWGGSVLLELGEYELCEQAVTRAVLRLRRSMDACREGMIAIHLARLALARGDLAGAAAQAAELERPIRTTGIPYLVMHLQLIEGRLALENGDLGGARAAFEKTVPPAEHMNVPWDCADVYLHLAMVDRADGDPGAAEDRLHRVLTLQLEHGFRGRAPGTLEALASIATAGDSSAEAVRLFAAAHALREATGAVRWPLDEPAREADLAALRATLGADAFAGLWEEGAGLSFADVAAYASRARGQRKRPSSGWASLTPTELEVVALAATGATNAQIGEKLFISPATAKSHLQHIYAKLGVANRAALAAEATSRGLGR